MDFEQLGEPSNYFLPLSAAVFFRRTESQWGPDWHWVMGPYPGQLCRYTEPRWASGGPADAHIINAERDECGCVCVWCCCTSPPHMGGGRNLHLCHTSPPEKKRTWFWLLFHHNIFSPYGQPPSWRGATVKCVPPPSLTAHSYSASHHYL